MATTRWADVVQALVTRMRATAGYRSPWSTIDGTSTAVFHSIEAALMNDLGISRYLIVGWAGDPDSLGEGGSNGQRIATLGTNRARDEAGSIPCMAVSQTGTGYEMTDAAVPAVLSDALAIVADVENALRVPADGPTLGISAPRMLAQIGEMRFFPVLNQGVTWRVEFSVVYDTRI